jgi:hypothetical protein
MPTNKLLDLERIEKWRKVKDEKLLNGSKIHRNYERGGKGSKMGPIIRFCLSKEILKTSTAYTYLLRKY